MTHQGWNPHEVAARYGEDAATPVRADWSLRRALRRLPWVLAAAFVIGCAGALLEMILHA